MNKMLSRGRTSKVDRIKLLDVLLKYKDNIITSNNKITSKKSEIWSKISEELGNVVTPQTLYVIVTCNRYNVREKLDQQNKSISDSFRSSMNKNTSVESQDNTSLTIEDSDVKQTYILKIRREEYLNMIIEKQYKRANRGLKPTLRRYNVFTPGIWEDVISHKIAVETPIKCGYNFHSHFISNNCKSGSIRASCKCGGTLHGVIEDRNPDDRNIYIVCTVTKGSKQCGKRWLRGINRQQTALEMIEKSAHVYRTEKANELMQQDESEPGILYSANVLRVAKHNFLKEQYLDKDPIRSIQIFKATNGANIIHNIGLDPFYVHYWLNHQIKIYQDYLKKKHHATLCIDATGSIIKKITKPGNSKTNHIFIYQGVINIDEENVQYNATQMISEVHNTNAILHWLNEWVRTGAPYPKEVICDSSRALLTASIRAFTHCFSMEEYSEACGDEIMPLCYIRIDVAHFIKLYASLLRGSSQRIRVFYLACIGQLLLCTDINDARKIFESIMYVSLSETEGTLLGGRASSAEKAKVYLKTLITHESVESLPEILGKDPCLNEINIQDENDSEKQNADINIYKHNSNKWTKWADNIKQNVENVIKVENGDRENAHYLPKLATKLLKDMSHFPMWSNVSKKRFGYGRIPASSAPAESAFNILKTHLLKNTVTPMRADAFLIKHINYLQGHLKLTDAKIRKAQISDPITNQFMSNNNAETEEVDKAKIENETSKCPACMNGDKPEGAHVCAICKKAVHALDDCSVPLDDNEEGYGQKRICFSCTNLKTIPQILATKEEENWRGLNEAKTKRRTAKYLGANKCTVKEQLMFGRNKKLLILKNGSHLSLHPITINEKKFYMTNTCAFDSLYQMILTCLCDRDNLRIMVEKENKENALIGMALQVLEKGVNSGTYYNRAKILEKLFDAVLQSDGSMLVNCATTIADLTTKLFDDMPSFIESLKCDKGCQQFLQKRPVPVINNFRRHVKSLDILKILELPGTHKCNLNGCNNILKRELSKIGNIVAFDIFISDPEQTIKLDDIPKRFISPLHTKTEYQLVGVINLKMGFTTRSSNTDCLGHYTAICLRGGQWIEYDDTCKKEKKCKINLEIYPTLLMYAQ